MPGVRRLVLIDAANCLYRAFFAPFPPLRTSDGTPTKAVYVFANMLRKLLREERPDGVAVVMDPPGRSFRRELYAGYKATRDAQPEELTPEEMARARQIASNALAGGKVLIALVASLATVGIGIWRDVLPGVR